MFGGNLAVFKASLGTIPGSPSIGGKLTGPR
jgi:hypothetical protein